MKLFQILGLFMFLASCGEYKPEEELDSEGGEVNTTCTLQLNWQSENNSKLHYPLSVYVFDGANNCVLRESIASAYAGFSASLPQGKYTVSVFSALSSDDFAFPFEVIPDSYIRLKNENRCTLPLQMGQARVSLNQSTLVNLTLSYMVSALHFSFNLIPEEAEAVQVAVSPVSSSVSFIGNYKNDSESSVISCRKEGHVWKSDAVYVFPCKDTQTHLSVTVRMPDKDEVYSYTYNASLKPGYPYHFTGNYSDGVSLDGEFQIEGWHPGVDIEFGFDEIQPDEGGGEEGGGNPSGGEGDDDEVISVNTLPQADAVWGPFYVWKVETISSKEVEAFLIAPDQYYTVASGTESILSAYDLDGIQGWRVFSKDEAEAFRDQFYSFTMEELNKFLVAEGLDGFYYTDGARYLCNEGKSTFCFYNKRVLDAGATPKYYLRPVKEVRLRKE